MFINFIYFIENKIKMFQIIKFVENKQIFDEQLKQILIYIYFILYSNVNRQMKSRKQEMN